RLLRVDRGAASTEPSLLSDGDPPEQRKVLVCPVRLQRSRRFSATETWGMSMSYPLGFAWLQRSRRFSATETSPRTSTAPHASASTEPSLLSDGDRDGAAPRAAEPESLQRSRRFSATETRV